MKLLITIFYLCLQIQSFAQKLNVRNQVEIPQRFLKQGDDLRAAELRVDDVYEIDGYVVFQNPRLLLDQGGELKISSRNITVQNLCFIFGFSYWDMRESSPFEEVEWGNTREGVQATVVLPRPTISSFEMNPFRDSEKDGHIRTLACKSSPLVI